MLQLWRNNFRNWIYFYTDIKGLQKLVEELDPTVEFNPTLVAQEYHQSLAMKEEQAVLKNVNFGGIFLKKLSKSLSLITSTLLLSSALIFPSVSSEDSAIAASYASPKTGSYWKDYKKVKLKKNITIYKIKKGISHAQDRTIKNIKLKKNSYAYIQSWCMSCGGTYVIKTKKLKPTKTTYYQTGYMDMDKKFWY